MQIKVLGGGCSKCKKLESYTKDACVLLGIDVNIEKVTDFKDIASSGVMQTPALMVNGKVIVSGHVPKVKQLVQMLEKLNEEA
jgi:small redox-active disulfide protein 2